MIQASAPLRALLVPDSVYWVTGTIAQSIVRHNPWLDGTIISGPLLGRAQAALPDLFSRFDLVHFVCPYASREWLPRLRDTHICVTTHHHVTHWEAQKHNLEADAIMTDSDEWVTDLLRRGIDPARVASVPPGVDCELFAPRSAEVRARVRGHYRIAQETLAVGFFGKSGSNEMGRKGVDVMIAAARRLRASGTRFTLLMTGPGWRPTVAEIEQAGIRVIWEPWVRERGDLADLYGALDCYWITSRIEGGPVTLLEAMSTELPCVTTPVGLVHELVRDGENALLVPIGDAQAVVHATTALARDPARRASLGKVARRDVQARYASAITMQRIADLYRRGRESFVARTGRPWRSTASSAAIPESLQTALRRWEALAWADHLTLYQSQPKEALLLIANELRRAPLEADAWRALLRNVLPQPIVRLIVRATSRR